MAGCFGFTQDFQDQQMQLLKEQRKKQKPAALLSSVGQLR
jgi:hypothetical protein